MLLWMHRWKRSTYTCAAATFFPAKLKTSTQTLGVSPIDFKIKQLMIAFFSKFYFKIAARIVSDSLWLSEQMEKLTVTYFGTTEIRKIPYLMKDILI